MMKCPEIVAPLGMALALACCAPAVILAGAAPAAAATFTVDDLGDDPDGNRGDGICSTGSVPPKCTLRAATNEANAWPGADSIVVPSGKYQLLLGCLLLTDEVTVTGAGMDKTIVDGTGNDVVVEVKAPGKTVSMSGMTIFRGVSSALRGGGVNNIASGRTNLVSLRIVGNAAETGGGVYNAAGSSMRIESCEIRDNLATLATGAAYGGGVANFGWLSIVDSSIKHNSAIATGVNEAWGGGVHSGAGGRLTIVRGAISGNHSLAPGGSAYGGGISADAVDVFSIEDADIGNNAAKSASADIAHEVLGGGLYLRDVATGTIDATSISANSVYSELTPAAALGGGIAVVSPTVPSAVTIGGASSITNNLSNSPANGGVYRQTQPSLVWGASTVVKGNLPK